MTPACPAFFCDEPATTTIRWRWRDETTFACLRHAREIREAWGGSAAKTSVVGIDEGVHVKADAGGDRCQLCIPKTAGERSHVITWADEKEPSRVEVCGRCAADAERLASGRSWPDTRPGLKVDLLD